MPRAIRLSSLAIFVLLVPALSFAQKADLKAEAVKELNEMKGTMVKIASAMPEDRFGFRATPPQRTFGEQTPDAMQEQVKMPWSGETESRLHVVYSMVGHAWDMYGQMAVYLRLNGHVPPASQRP